MRSVLAIVLLVLASCSESKSRDVPLSMQAASGTGQPALGGARAAGADAQQTVGRWEPLPAAPAELAGRAHAGVVFDGQRVYIWGGSGACGATGNAGGFCGDGGIYDYDARRWSVMSAAGAPAARQAPSLFWSGSKLWIFGGACARNEPCLNGASYDPASGSWQLVALPTWLEPRIHPFVALSGTRIVIWGGQLPAATGARRASTATGALYDTESGMFTPIATQGAPEPGATVALLGDALVAPVGPRAGRLVPGAQAWEPLDVSASPAACCSEMVSTTTQLLGWDGKPTQAAAEDFRFDVQSLQGFVYDGSSRAWRAMAAKAPPIPLPAGAYVWTGEALIIWGGTGGLPEWGCEGHSQVCNYGAIYDPGLDSWRELNREGAPAPRGNPVALWTRDTLFIWGGTSTTAPNTYADGALLHVE